jgi:hypothetical protein
VSGKEVNAVVTATKPTNERIAEMLAQILREVGDVKKTQAQLAADLSKIAKAAG